MKIVEGITKGLPKKQRAVDSVPVMPGGDPSLNRSSSHRTDSMGSKSDRSNTCSKSEKSPRRNRRDSMKNSMSQSMKNHKTKDKRRSTLMSSKSMSVGRGLAEEHFKEEMNSSKTKRRTSTRNLMKQASSKSLSRDSSSKSLTKSDSMKQEKDHTRRQESIGADTNNTKEKDHTRRRVSSTKSRVNFLSKPTQLGSSRQLLSSVSETDYDCDSPQQHHAALATSSAALASASASAAAAAASAATAAALAASLIPATDAKLTQFPPDPRRIAKIAAIVASASEAASEAAASAQELVTMVANETTPIPMEEDFDLTDSTQELSDEFDLPLLQQ